MNKYQTPSKKNQSKKCVTFDRVKDNWEVPIEKFEKKTIDPPSQKSRNIHISPIRKIQVASPMGNGSNKMISSDSLK